jgi:hypothetical protein
MVSILVRFLFFGNVEAFQSPQKKSWSSVINKKIEENSSIIIFSPESGIVAGCCRGLLELLVAAVGCWSCWLT